MTSKNPKHDPTEDWWDVLMLSPHASARDIHQAYETLRMSYLPINRDRLIPVSREATEQLQKLDRAFRLALDNKSQPTPITQAEQSDTEATQRLLKNRTSGLQRVTEIDTQLDLQAGNTSKGSFFKSFRLLHSLQRLGKLAHFSVLLSVMAFVMAVPILLMMMLGANLEAVLTRFHIFKYNFFIILGILLSFGAYALVSEDKKGSPAQSYKHFNIGFSIFLFVFFFMNLVTCVQSRNPYVLLDLFDLNIFRLNLLLIFFSTLFICFSLHTNDKSKFVSNGTMVLLCIWGVSNIYLATKLWSSKLVVDPNMDLLACVRYLLNL